MLTKLLKEIVGERRPDGDNGNSFPSEHAALCVAAAIFIEREHRRRIGTAAWALAAGIGLARIESKRHYPSDVLAGAAIGWLAAHITLGLNQAAVEVIGTGIEVSSDTKH
jgi:membrane-associated phospholipid phosphatase